MVLGKVKNFEMHKYILRLNLFSPYMNLEKGMYSPERSPTIGAGGRRQHSASILLQDAEMNEKDRLNPDYDGPAKYDSPTPEELANTQKLDQDKVK